MGIYPDRQNPWQPLNSDNTITASRVMTPAIIDKPNSKRHLILFVSIALCGLLWRTAAADSANKYPHSVSATTHMVSAAHPLAAEAGLSVLEAGGTAMDAAVAVQMMLTLVEPESSGIGGGAFLLYWDAHAQKLVTFDGRETAPAAANERYFYRDGEPLSWPDARTGGLSVGVPGTVKLLETAHKQYGKLSWSRLFLPTIKVARKGFVINEKLEQSIARAAETGLRDFDDTRAYFFTADGQPKTAGMRLTNNTLADTLTLIAAHGADVFYTGVIAESIVNAVTNASNPGMMTLQDLADYRALQRDPVCFDYRGYSVCGMGPPTSGGLTMGQILGMLSGFDLATAGPGIEAWHRYIESAKLAYADRGLYMADSDFVDMPEGLLNPDYLRQRAALIDASRAMVQAEPGNPPWDEAQLQSPDTQTEKPGTSHFVIADKFGNRLSMTTTIESGFGSRVMTRGFLLNNELTDFSFRYEHDGKPIANRVEGSKRPRSSMSPTIVLKNNQPYLLTGSPGGSRIINYVTQSVIAVLDWHMDPQDAIDMGHVVNRNGKTDLEAGTEAEQLAAGLQALGHETNVRELNSGLHMILIDQGTLYGAADPRRAGIAVGR